MRKGIFKSMLVGSTIIVVMTFAIAIMMFSKFVETSSIEQESVLMSNNVDRINDISRVAFANSSTNMDIIYRTMIDNLSYNLGASVIVFDTNGKIITVSGLSKDKYINQTLNKRLYDDIIKGEEVTKIGMLDELHDGASTLTVGAPLIANGKVYAGVFISRPVPDIVDAYQGLILKLIVMIFISIMFSLLLFYVISKRITNPVREINNAVNEFAKGNFDKRVEYVSEDELGELAANINRMATSIDNLERMRSGFVSDVSHELRTPMTTISGFVEGILDGTIDESERDNYLKLVLSESKRLSKLVTDLLDLNRMQNGELPLECSEFDIIDLTYQALVKFEKQIDEGEFEIEMNVPDGKLAVIADKDSITQVLINLLGNAIKFTPHGGTISIRMWKHQLRAYVEIKNTGKGIEPEKLQFIWDRFYKTDQSRSMDKSGFGLGLCIVKSIIDKHNEKIWVESEPNKYTLFTFSVKLK
ncbi:MAG: HAMP domain-containing protein [Clostridia bacterium]|nr:HAMP domain-containing protein [Clostridia bacterium]